MILGIVTVGCLLVLIAVCGLKLWNISHWAKQYSLVWVFATWGISVIALAGLVVVLTSNVYNLKTDASYLTDVFEAGHYLNFGWILLSLNTLFSVAEALLFLNFFVFERERGKPSEGRQNSYA